MNFLNMADISQIAVLTVALIQYIKPYVPEKIIKPYIQGVVAIGFSFLIQLYMGQLNYVSAVVNGMLATLVSESGYQILSTFGLRSKDIMG